MKDLNVRLSIEDIARIAHGLSYAWIAQVSEKVPKEKSDETLILRERLIVQLPANMRSHFVRLLPEEVLDPSQIKSSELEIGSLVCDFIGRLIDIQARLPLMNDYQRMTLMSAVHTALPDQSYEKANDELIRQRALEREENRELRRTVAELRGRLAVLNGDMR